MYKFPYTITTITTTTITSTITILTIITSTITIIITTIAIDPIICFSTHEVFEFSYVIQLKNLVIKY